MTTGPNLLGQEHTHNCVVPFHGHLMCDNFYCAEVVTTEGEALTEEQRLEINRILVRKYTGKRV